MELFLFLVFFLSFVPIRTGEMDPLVLTECVKLSHRSSHHEQRRRLEKT